MHFVFAATLPVHELNLVLVATEGPPQIARSTRAPGTLALTSNAARCRKGCGRHLDLLHLREAQRAAPLHPPQPQPPPRGARYIMTFTIEATEAIMSRMMKDAANTADIDKLGDHIKEVRGESRHRRDEGERPRGPAQRLAPRWRLPQKQQQDYRTTTSSAEAGWRPRHVHIRDGPHGATMPRRSRQCKRAWSCRSRSTAACRRSVATKSTRAWP